MDKLTEEAEEEGERDCFGHFETNGEGWKFVVYKENQKKMNEVWESVLVQVVLATM